MNDIAQIVASAPATTAIKTEWGYVNCDKRTYKKLKTLMRCYQLTLRQFASWKRWNRKLPHNRVWKTYEYNDKQQRIGVKSTAPMSEPRVCSIFTISTANGPKFADIVGRFSDWYHDSKPVPNPVRPLNGEEVGLINALAKEFEAYEAARA